MESIGFSMYTIMSSANSDSLIFSFPTWMPFIAFSHLIAVAKTSNTMLNRSGERGHPCLVPDLSGRALSFCPLSMMLALVLSYLAFQINNLTLHLQELEEQQQRQPRASRSKDITTIRAEVNDIETKSTILRINESRICFF